MRIGKIGRQRIRKGVIYFLIAVIILFVNLPFLSMAGTAFKPASEMLSAELFPKNPTFDNIINTLINSNFLIQFKNSAVVALSCMVICVVAAATAGYALSRKKTPLFRSYLNLLLILQMFPIILLLLPIFLIFRGFGLVNTLYALILAYSAVNLPFSIWTIRSFFNTLPYELEEAAKIDGCSQFGIFARIVLPLSLPGLATISIFVFINCWNEYLLASLFIRKPALYTLTIGLRHYITEHSYEWSSLMSASLLSIAPSIIYMLIAQKYLVQGLVAGSVKG
jgi:ABC-type glycerol-3-phosphate transport system permease component